DVIALFRNFPFPPPSTPSRTPHSRPLTSHHPLPRPPLPPLPPLPPPPRGPFPCRIPPLNPSGPPATHPPHPQTPPTPPLPPPPRGPFPCGILTFNPSGKSATHSPFSQSTPTSSLLPLTNRKNLELTSPPFSGSPSVSITSLSLLHHFSPPSAILLSTS